MGRNLKRKRKNNGKNEQPKKRFKESKPFIQRLLDCMVGGELFTLEEIAQRMRIELTNKNKSAIHSSINNINRKNFMSLKKERKFFSVERIELGYRLLINNQKKFLTFRGKSEKMAKDLRTELQRSLSKLYSNKIILKEFKKNRN